MSSFVPTSTAVHLLQTLGFVWAGLVLGISFLEAPVKFTAPSLTRAVGLDVGRHVFAALNKVEIGFGVLGGGLWFFAGFRPDVRWGLAAVVLILAVQTVWLLPALRAQAETIIQGGEEPNKSYTHVAYVFLEVAKVAALLYVGWCSTA